jgi:hypothetical protein
MPCGPCTFKQRPVTELIRQNGVREATTAFGDQIADGFSRWFAARRLRPHGMTAVGEQVPNAACEKEEGMGTTIRV